MVLPKSSCHQTSEFIFKTAIKFENVKRFSSVFLFLHEKLTALVTGQSLANLSDFFF